MKLHHVATGLFMVLGLALMARAADKKDVDKEKVLGTWECTEGPEHIKGATVEFLKDGNRGCAQCFVALYSIQVDDFAKPGQSHGLHWTDDQKHPKHRERKNGINANRHRRDLQRGNRLRLALGSFRTVGHFQPRGFPVASFH